MSKNYKYRDIPGFHGDTEEDVDLHHATPIRWTAKMTVWSIGMFVIFIALAAVIFVTAADKQ